MNNYQTRISIAKLALQEAGAILVGGGAGLSAAAGLLYSGKRFTEPFAPFIEKYGFKDLYTSSFYAFTTEEEKWAYWARHISLNRYETGPTKLYQDLYRLVQVKPFFVITTNVESQFEKSGFPPEQIFEIQGNYRYLQCANGCHDKRYDNEQLVMEMIEKTVDCKILSELVPKCPVCKGKMDPNLRSNQYFVQDENWYIQDAAYKRFLNKYSAEKIVFLELGVGFNTPGIIRYPFERMAYHNENARIIRLNKNDPIGVEENKKKTIAFAEDMQEVVLALME